MNQRKAGTILSYAYILITNTISIFYTPFMLRMMGTSEYGLYGTAGSFISYLSVLSFGVGGAYIRFNARARAAKDRDAEKKLNGMFLTVFSVLSVLVFIGGMLFILLAGQLVKQSFTSEELLKLRIIMFVLTINMMITFICNVFMMALQAYEQFFMVRLTLLIAGILQPVINVMALLAGGRAITITVINLIVSAVSYSAMFIYARKVIRFEVCFHGFDKQVLKEIFIFSGFLFLNSVTDQITFSTDNIVLSSVKGTAAVAVYSVGSSFKNYFQSFSTAISGVFAPQVNRIVASKGSDDALNEIFIRVGRIQFYVVSLIIIGFCSIGHPFIRLWAGDDYGNSYYIALLLMLSVAVPAFQNVSIEIQKAKNLHKARSVVYFFIALFNVIMTIPLAIKWSGIGAAAATTICMVTGYAGFMNYYNWKYVGIDIPGFWKSIFKILPGYIPPIAFGILINRYWQFKSLWEILLFALIILGIFCVSVWFISMNTYERNLFGRPFGKLHRRFKKE